MLSSLFRCYDEHCRLLCKLALPGRGTTIMTIRIARNQRNTATSAELLFSSRSAHDDGVKRIGWCHAWRGWGKWCRLGLIVRLIVRWRCVNRCWSSSWNGRWERSLALILDQVQFVLCLFQLLL